MRISDRILSASFLTVIVSAPATSQEVIVYGDHQPTYFTDGRSFEAPFVFRDSPGDRDSRVSFETVPGLRKPLGTNNWGQAAYGKYLLGGTHNPPAGGRCPDDLGDICTFDNWVEDHLINIFDSEEKDNCMLDVTGPAVIRNQASSRTLITASPDQRHSRIYFAGRFGDWAFGYIEADLDQPDPCSWRVVQVTQAMLDAGRTPGEVASSFEYDGLNILRHEESTTDPYGVDYVLLPNWWGHRVSVVRVDSTGVNTLDTYVLPPMGPPAICDDPNSRVECVSVACPGTTCGLTCPIHRRPVQLPQVDRTRPRNDQRFTLFYETYQAFPILYPGPCGLGVGAQEFRIDLDALTPTIGATSRMFYPAADPTNVQSHHPSGLDYDSNGGLWTNDRVPDPTRARPGLYQVKQVGDTCVINGVTIPVTAGSRFVGEHCYYDTSEPNDFTRVDSDQVFPVDQDPPTNANVYPVQVSDTTYFLTSRSIQRAQASGRSWNLESPQDFKVGLPTEMLPAEARKCAHPTDEGRPCVCPDDTKVGEECLDAVHCGEDASPPLCVPRDESEYGGGGGTRLLVVGGSPKSLWSPQMAYAARPVFPPYAASNFYWNRVPIQTKIPDGTTTGRVGLAWNGERLWMAARRTNGLQFRVRDAGLWSEWYALPANGAVAGGVSVIATSQRVEIFARVGNAIQTTHLVSSNLDCVPEDCVWTNWSTVSISGSVTPTSDPAVAYEDGIKPFFVVRGSDRKLYYAQAGAGAASQVWRQIPGLLTEYAPSVTWHAAERRFWVAARDRRDGLIRVARIAPGMAPTGWQSVAKHSSLDWQTAPTILWDGSQIRLFASQTGSPYWIYQSSYQGEWSPWDWVRSWANSAAQSAAASVNGDVTLVSQFGSQLYESLATPPSRDQSGPSDVELMVVGDLDGDGRDDVVLDYGPGKTFTPLWVWKNNSGWQEIPLAHSPLALAVGDIDGNGQDDLVAVFREGLEIAPIRVWMNNSEWKAIDARYSAESIVIADLDGNGLDDIIADYGSEESFTPLWVYRNNDKWHELRFTPSPNRSPLLMTAANLDGDAADKDEIVLDYGSGFGLRMWRNDATWEGIGSATGAEILVTGDLDGNGVEDLIVDYGYGQGFAPLWSRMNNSNWVILDGEFSPENLVVGNVNGMAGDDLVADYGDHRGDSQSDLWLLLDNNTASWTALGRGNPGRLAIGDLNNSGLDDIVADYGHGYIFDPLWKRIDNLWFPFNETDESTLGSVLCPMDQFDPVPVCGIGFELALLLPILMKLRRRNSTSRPHSDVGRKRSLNFLCPTVFSRTEQRRNRDAGKIS